tara:strand:- start:9 stop:125 length:117 start_codon:yes stop_codon:yes gene_type:complete
MLPEKVVEIKLCVSEKIIGLAMNRKHKWYGNENDCSWL